MAGNECFSTSNMSDSITAIALSDDSAKNEEELRGIFLDTVSIPCSLCVVCTFAKLQTDPTARRGRRLDRATHSYGSRTIRDYYSGRHETRQRRICRRIRGIERDGPQTCSSVQRLGWGTNDHSQPRLLLLDNGGRQGEICRMSLNDSSDSGRSRF